MATSQKVTDQFLTCTVCMEVFNDPVTLLCYHTFCRKCLVSFTKTQPEAVTAKSLPCPFCRKFTKVPDPNGSLEKWAAQMKPSFLIQGLIDSFGPGTKDTTRCSYCKADGKTTPATVWCSVCDDSLCGHCVTTHNQIPHFRHHNVADLSDDVKVMRKRKVMCKEHPEEKVELLCKDCKKIVCHKCCTIYHRKCESVLTIESELSTMTSALTGTRKTLLKKQEDLILHAEQRKSKVAEMTEIYSQSVKEIETQSRKARDLINLKEKKCLDELKDVTDKHIGQIKAEIKTAEMAIQMYQQQSELIDEAVKSDCEMNIYEMYQSCDSEAMETLYDRDTDMEDKRKVDRIRFRKNTDNLTQTLNELQLGTIDFVYESRPDLKATPVLLDTIDVRVTGDLNKPNPTGVTVLDVNGMDTAVVTDWRNNSVKSFYNRNNQPCHSKLSLDGPPWGLTQLTHNGVAVTVLDTKQIVTVEVKPELKLLSTITTSKQYWGITALTPSTVAAGCESSSPSVDILDMNGTVIKSIVPQAGGRVILKIPGYLCTTRKGNILVSDRGTKSVVCLTPQGDVVFSYSPTGDRALKDPRGITVTNTGDILVADRDLNSVLHLTESGQFVRNILTSQDGLSGPQGLCYNSHGRLYVCLFYERVIKVLKCTS